MTRQIPEETKQKLRERAAKNGRSMEAEVRELIEQAVAKPSAETNAPGNPWLVEMLNRVDETGGIDIVVPSRRASENTWIPDFSE